jgi:hypothetical protein
MLPEVERNDSAHFGGVFFCPEGNSSDKAS